MTVRPASVSDQEEIYWLLLNDLNADNSLGFRPSPKKVFEHVHCCCTGRNGVAGVIDGPRGIIGSIGIELVQPWHSDDWFLMQVWQFVHPDYRHGTSHGLELFTFAEEHRKFMCQALNCDMVLETTVMSHKRLEAKKRLWRRHGKELGAIYWSGGNGKVY